MLTAAQIPFYMTAQTARDLLAASRARRTMTRARRELSAQLRRLGWGDDAAAELARIHLEMQSRNMAPLGLPINHAKVTQ